MTCHVLLHVCLVNNQTIYVFLFFYMRTFAHKFTFDRETVQKMFVDAPKVIASFFAITMITSYLMAIPAHGVSTYPVTHNDSGNAANGAPIDLLDTNNSSRKLSRPVFTTSSGSTLIQLNKPIKLILSAEGREAIATYSTKTPDICSVSTEGVVLGLNGGTCSILASITGSNSYPGATPTVIVLIVDDVKTELATITPKKAEQNVMTVSRENGNFIIKLNLISSFKFQKANLQIGLRNSLGKLSYRGVKSITLNSEGDGSITQNATYAKTIYFRAIVNNKVVITKKTA